MACIKSALLGTFLASISVVSFSHNAKALDLSGPFNLAQNQDNQGNSQYQGNQHYQENSQYQEQNRNHPDWHHDRGHHPHFYRHS